MRLSRFYHSSGQVGGTAGIWVIPDTGLMLYHRSWGWRVEITTLLHPGQLYRGPVRPWYRSRQAWLQRHGLDRAQFQRRRDALAAAEYALARDPLAAPTRIR